MRLMLPRGQIKYRRLKMRKALVEKGRERIGGDSSPRPPPPHRQQAKMDPGPNDAGLYRSRSLQSPRWQLTKHFSWFSVLPWSKPCATKTTGKTLSAIPLHNFLAFWSCTKEASVAARSGPGDVILQGFVRVKKANQRKKMLEHLSEDGLFIEFLAKPDVY